MRAAHTLPVRLSVVSRYRSSSPTLDTVRDRDISPIPPLHLAYISPVSPHLGARQDGATLAALAELTEVEEDLLIGGSRGQG